jgi:DNA topoisomerase IB
MLHPVENNELYVFGFGDYKHYKYVNDQFFYHNESLVDSMCNFADNMQEFEELCDADKSIHGARIEYMFYLYLQKMGITYKQTHISGEFVRAINI